MENLPAEIIFLVFRNIYLRDEIESLKYIIRIGEVSKFIRQVELKFWKQKLIERNGSRLSGVLRKFKSPKLTYLAHYFGCSQCGQLAIFRCEECSNLGCRDCYAKISCECAIFDEEHGRPVRYSCPDHPSDWMCHQCAAPICSDCFKMCWRCQNVLCEKCVYNDEIGRDWCGPCYGIQEDPEIGVSLPLMTELPAELLLTFFQLIFADLTAPVIDRVKSVTRFGSSCKVLSKIENTFWRRILRQTWEAWIPRSLRKFCCTPKEQSQLSYHLANMPAKLGDNPKEVFLYSKFSCEQCGKKGVLNECKKCQMKVCSSCGHQRQCTCNEICKEDDFLCYYCQYRCSSCQQDLCQKCFGLCSECGKLFCYRCHFKHKKGERLLYEEWEYALAIEEANDGSNSDENSDLDNDEKNNLIGVCVQCGDHIYEEEELGHCSSCEYYNEINEYNLCKNCIDTCQICHEQHCVNCMILYHEPCEQWKMCPSCKSEVSQLHPCVKCRLNSCCEYCHHFCQECSDPVCKMCLIKEGTNASRMCHACVTEKQDPMQM